MHFLAPGEVSRAADGLVGAQTSPSPHFIMNSEDQNLPQDYQRLTRSSCPFVFSKEGGQQHPEKQGHQSGEVRLRVYPCQACCLKGAGTAPGLGSPEPGPNAVMPHSCDGVSTTALLHVLKALAGRWHSQGTASEDTGANLNSRPQDLSLFRTSMAQVVTSHF